MIIVNKMGKLNKIFIFIWIGAYILSETRMLPEMFYKIKLVLTILISLILFINKSKNGINIKKNNRIIIIMIFIMSILYLSKSLYSPLSMRILEISISYIVFFIFTLVIIPSFYEDDRNFDMLILYTVKVITFFIVFGVFMGILDWNNSYTEFGERFRVIWIFKNANSIGSICYLNICLTIYLIIIYKFKKSEKMLIASLITSALTLFLCDSRTPLYSIVITLVIYYLYTRLIKLKNYNNSKVLNILIIIVIILTTMFITIIISKLDLNQLTSGRMLYWDVIWNGLTEIEKLIGITFESTQNNLLSFYYWSNKTQVVTDSYYLFIIYHFGVLNLIYIFLIIGYILSCMIRNITKIHKSEYEYRDSVIVLSIFIGFLVYAFFEGIFISISNITSIYIWIFIGKYISRNKSNRR